MAHNWQIGDVVAYKKQDSFWVKGEVHIIAKINYLGGGAFQYATNKGAWFSGTDFILIHRATKASLQQLDQSLDDNYEDIQDDS